MANLTQPQLDAIHARLYEYKHKDHRPNAQDRALEDIAQIVEEGVPVGHDWTNPAEVWPFEPDGLVVCDRCGELPIYDPPEDDKSVCTISGAEGN